MSEKFDLERRAAELLSKDHYFSGGVAIAKALQLASELAEAIAAECKWRLSGIHEDHVARREAWRAATDIARSFVRPRSREELYKAELELIVASTRGRTTGDIAAIHESAQRALDEGAKVEK